MTRTAAPTLLLLLSLLLGSPDAAPAQRLSALSASDLETGRRLYRARCARCHGVEGGGGEGPALNRPYLRYARDDQTLVSVVRNGIPGTAMQASPWLSDLEVRQIAGYVRSLGRTGVAEEPSGDPTLGAALYREEGGCAACHGVRGRGTRFGPELTRVGFRRSLDFIRRSIVEPGATLPSGLTDAPGSAFADYLPVTVTDAGGASVRGHRVDETSFRILVRDTRGRLHAFDKTELDTLVKRFGQSLMPAYGDVFTDRELDHLVAYLVRLGEDGR